MAGELAVVGGFLAQAAPNPLGLGLGRLGDLLLSGRNSFANVVFS
jgi:hypothetical protein